MVNRLKSIFVLAALVAGAFAVTPSWAANVVVSTVQGEVMISRRATPDTWEPITSDTGLESGDSVKTREGSCTLMYTDQATFEVIPNTQLTLTDRAENQELNLLIGNIRGKVNKEKALKPFQVVTPAAVAAIRGTEVDFGFNDQGEMTVDLHNGAIQVLNDENALTLDLGGSKKILIKYDKEANTLLVRNDCASDGPITFSVLGTQYTNNPCADQVVELSTAENGTETPNILTQNDPENPDDGREPISPSQP